MALVGSSGGHLEQLLVLRDWWSDYERFWVTFRKADAESALTREKVYWCYYPTNRHVLNLIRNTVLAARILWRERPDFVVSTGAGAAIPYFYLAKVFGCRTCFIEVYDRIDTASITGRVVYPVTDLVLLQWESQRKAYPKGVLVGELL